MAKNRDRFQDESFQMKQINRALFLINKCNQAIIHASNESELLSQICKIFTDDRNFTMAWVGFAEIINGEKLVIPVAISGDSNNYLQTVIIKWDDSKFGQGPTGMAIKTMEHVANNSIEESERYKPWKKDATKRGYRSSIALPLNIDGVCIGALNLYSDTKEIFIPDEIELLMKLSANIAYGLRSIRVEQERETLYKAIEESPLSVVVTDPNGIISYVSPYFTKLTGYSANEMKNKNHYSLKSPNISDRNYQSIWESVHAGRVWRNVLQNKNKSGKTYWVDNSIAPVRDAQGKLINYIDIQLDITSKVKAEQDLKKSEERYRTLFNHAPIGIIVIKDNIIQFVNPTLLHFYGYVDEAELIGSDVDIIVPPYLQEQRRIRSVRRQQGKDEPTHYFSEGITKEGGIIPLELYVTQIEFDGDYAILAFINDLSSFKQTQTALELAEDRIKTILNDTPIVLWSTDETGRITIAEGSGLKILGISMDTDLIEHFNEYISQHPSIAVSHERALNGETFVKTEKLGSFYFDTRYYPLVDDQQNIIGIGAIGIDVTEKQEAENQLKKTQDALTQTSKLEAIGKLAGGVAHDFNNMLTVILGYGALLSNDLADNHQLHGYVHEIIEVAGKSSDLVKQLLAFAKKQYIHASVQDIDPLIRETTKMIRLILGEDIELNLKLVANPGKILIDPSQFNQILMNLVINSRDAMPLGGTITIETALNDNSTIIYLRVIDDGEGMDETTLSQLFDPFYTTKSYGSGLGLATVYGIVKQNNISIDVTSSVGIGTTFELGFPIVDGESETKEEEIELIENKNQLKSILLVEDDESLNNLVKRVLNDNGYNVTAKINPEHALNEIINTSVDFDLIISDLIMPNMNGIDFYQKSRSKTTAKFLFITGYSEVSFNKSGLDDDYFLLEKPFTPVELISTINGILN